MRLWLLGLGLLALGGCQRGGGEGDLLVHWSRGSDSGQRARLLARGLAHWCEGPGMMEVIALGNDTGVAIAIYPQGKLSAGEYPVRPPLDSLTRPRATLALRLLGLNLIHGYYGTSGSVRIREADGVVSGNLEARLQELSGGTIELEGEFRRLAVTADSAGCPPGAVPGPAPAPASPDTSLR